MIAIAIWNSTLTNNGVVNVKGEVSLNIVALAGEELNLLDGAIVKNSTVGGSVFVAGNVTFRGANTFAMLYDYGTLTDYYGTTAPMKWTVEEGASVTLTNAARYGLGYGDDVTVYLNLTETGLIDGNPGTDIEEVYINNGYKLETKVGEALPDATRITSTSAGVTFGGWYVYEEKLNPGVPTIYETAPTKTNMILQAFWTSENTPGGGNQGGGGTTSSGNTEILDALTSSSVILLNKFGSRIIFLLYNSSLNILSINRLYATETLLFCLLIIFSISEDFISSNISGSKFGWYIVSFKTSVATSNKLTLSWMYFVFIVPVEKENLSVNPAVDIPTSWNIS